MSENMSVFRKKSLRCSDLFIANDNNSLVTGGITRRYNSNSKADLIYAGSYLQLTTMFYVTVHIIQTIIDS